MRPYGVDVASGWKRSPGKRIRKNSGHLLRKLRINEATARATAPEPFIGTWGFTRKHWTIKPGALEAGVYSIERAGRAGI